MTNLRLTAILRRYMSVDKASDPGQGAAIESRDLSREVTLYGQTFVTGLLLGEGAMGRVFVISDPINGGIAACKESKLPDKPEERARVLAMLGQEAKVLAALNHLNHPALPRFLAADLDRQPPAIIFEYVPGETLETKVERDGPLDEATIMEVIRWIGGGLAAMHQLPPETAREIAALLGETEPITSLVYLDPKLSNILVTGDPTRPYRLVDYGTTQTTHFRSKQPLEERHISVAVYGTPPFADPNYAWYKELLLTADVYAFAATILDMALPGGIQSEVTAQIEGYLMNQQLYDPTQPWPLVTLVDQTSLSPQLRAVLKKSLSLRLADRPQDMREFLQRLPLVVEDDYQIDADGVVSFETKFREVTPPQAQVAYSNLLALRDPVRANKPPPADDLEKQLRLLAEVTTTEPARQDFSRLMGSVLGGIESRINSEPHPLIVALKHQRDIFVRPADLIRAICNQQEPRQLAEALELQNISASADFWEPLTAALDDYDLQPFIEVERTITTTWYDLMHTGDEDIARAFQRLHQSEKQCRDNEIETQAQSHLDIEEDDCYSLSLDDIENLPDGQEKDIHRINYDHADQVRLDAFLVEPIQFTYTTKVANPNASIIAHAKAEALFAAAPLLHTVTRPFFVRALHAHPRLLISSVVLDWLTEDMAKTRTGDIPSGDRRPRYLEAIDFVREAINRLTLYSDPRLNERKLTLSSAELPPLLKALRILIPATIAMDREFSVLEGEHPEFERYFMKSMMRTWADPAYAKGGTIFHTITHELMTILVEDEQLREKTDLITPYVLTRCHHLKEEIAGIKPTDSEGLRCLLQELYLFARAPLSRETRRALCDDLESFTLLCETLAEEGNPAAADLIRQSIQAIVGK